MHFLEQTLSGRAVLHGAACCIAIAVVSTTGVRAEAPEPAIGDALEEEAPKQTELAFVGESTTVFLRGYAVEAKDVKPVVRPGQGEPPRATSQSDREPDPRVGSPKARVALSIRNDGDHGLPAGSFMLHFRAITKLGEPIAKPRRIRARQLGRAEFRPKSVTTLNVELLGLEAGWNGLAILQPCTPEKCARVDLADLVEFKPITLPFSVVDRNVGSGPLLIPLAATGFFLIFALGSYAKGGRQLGWRAAINDWESWTFKGNMVPVVTLSGAVLAALVAASGKLDRLAGIDIGLFMALNIVVGGAGGASVLVARAWQAEKDGSLRPAVLGFWVAMAISVFAATGLLTATGYLVVSMASSDDWLLPWVPGLIPSLIILGMVMAGACVVGFAVQVTLRQSREKPKEGPTLEQAIVDATKSCVEAKPLREALAAVVKGVATQRSGP